MSRSALSDKEIILLLKEGDKLAFSQLYERYWAKVYNYSKLYLNSRDAINECVQDVFVRIWESRHLLDVDKNIKGYIFIITRNIIFHHFKNKLNHAAIDITLIGCLTDRLNAENILIEQELKEAIDFIITKLPLRQRQAFNLSRYDQLSYKEIAEIMNISEKTVEHHIGKALKYIRENLKDVFVFLPYIFLP